MGFHMATNIRRAMAPSGTLVINDMNRAACEKFQTELGHIGPIKIASTAKEVATLSKTVITMVPTGFHSRSVFLEGANSIINAPADGDRLILECSTIDMKTCKEVAQKVMHAGLGRYIDAPVSGGVSGAKRGSLSFMAGCASPSPGATDSMEARAHAMMSIMGDPNKVFYTEKLGTGLAAKIVNNYIACCTTLATAEAMSIGVRSGIEPDTLFRIIKASSGNSWHLDFNPCMPDMVATAPSSNGFAPSFPPFLAVKDLNLGIEAGKDVGIVPRCAEAACQTFKEAAEHPRYKIYKHSDNQTTESFIYASHVLV
ncbi:6-phosphogluconate dehydrogenase [Aspergillus pseudoustus]|uniref:6-phosphogluconate dehydrogenase n=1 Tax=Aspergillus pseudoustus TaxID=1810923 RepID=A0ABR4JVQ8_9EURO